jgi:hypothetical protein
VTPPAAQEQASSLAAKDAAAGARSRHDLAALDLISRAKAGGATWAAIGAALGMTGPEAKRHARKLRTRTRRAALERA